MTREPLVYPRTSTPVAQCFEEFFFIFYFSLFLVCKSPTLTVFTKPLIQIDIHLFEPTANHLHEENSSLCSTLEPLYCSSYATAVGGIRFINFVDSNIPIAISNHLALFFPMKPFSYCLFLIIPFIPMTLMFLRQ